MCTATVASTPIEITAASTPIASTTASILIASTEIVMITFAALLIKADVTADDSYGWC